VITVVGGRAFLLDAETFESSWDTLEPYFSRIIDSFLVR
jgi:hypothetical protein